MALAEYRRKRNFKVTSEPGGRRAARSKAPIFVVQHHFATREHYDFRLELDGVLKSWAVPKGPSTESHVKRLAVEVEDHPLPYARFHGRIPAGQYGAGTVSIWDHGTWVPEGDPHRSLKEGELVFSLKGKKLSGRWALIRMKPSERFKGKNNWLLFFKGETGKTGETGRQAMRATRSRSRGHSAALSFVSPQLATLAEAPPSGPGWVHETKLDGYRIQALVSNGSVRLMTRSGKDWTERFPSIARALATLKHNDAILDGEVVALDKAGRSSFHLLQTALEEGAKIPLRYSVFDILELNGENLRDEPLSERRRTLVTLLGKARSPIQVTQRLKAPETQLLDLACRLGLEGVVSKRVDAPYRSVRNRDWIKSKCGQRQEFVIVGFTEPAGSRNDLGALLLGVQQRGAGVIYTGKVGTGFDTADRSLLRGKLDRLERSSSPLAQPPKERIVGKIHWVRPTLVAEVSFTEWTPDGLLRHPVFQGLRRDKAASAVRRERPKAVASTGAKPKSAGSVVAGVAITHPERMIFPDSKISKLELAEYYQLVAPLMLPHLGGRPLSLVRCPEGQGGACFYQKHWTGTTPGIATVQIEEDDGAKRPYAVVRDAKGLITLVQYGVLEFHPWGSRADKTEVPDRIILDLDPAPDVAWSAVKAGATALRAVLAELGLECWLKTTGGKGLHVVIPFQRRITWELCSAFAKAIAERVAGREPDRYLTVASKAARTGKIFIDWLRNSRGATAVAPWSTRAREGAPVSVPIEWEDLARLKSGDGVHLHDVAKLISGRYVDPWRDLPDSRQRITREMVGRVAGKKKSRRG